jgi:alkyl hydroperoxide reductase subunit D
LISINAVLFTSRNKASPMSIETLKSQLPEYAKDLKLNLASVAAEAALNEQQRWGALVATAIASRNGAIIRAVEAEARGKLSPEALAAAKTAAAIMAMNNVYYRFVHLVGQDDYRTMPARLRMNALAKPGVDKADFELWSLAVSAVNGCGMCIESHEKVLRDHGVSRESIQAAVRIAAVVHAVAVTLEAETTTAAALAVAA